MTNVSPKIVYSAQYDIHFRGLERLHPFDGRKYSRAWGELKRAFGDGLDSFLVPLWRPGLRDEREVFASVHTEGYLEQLKSNDYVARALEMPLLSLLSVFDRDVLNKHVLEPMRWATWGTVAAAEASLQNGLAVNLGGGYHHASQKRGEGFCIYADIAIAVSKLRREGKLGPEDRVLIVDLDAHQGNGLERVYHDDPRVYFLDMFNGDIYPNDRWAYKRIDAAVPLPSGTGDREYLARLAEELPQALERAGQVALAFYIAGTDVYHEDQLGKLALTGAGVLRRDMLVLDSLVRAGVPCVMVLGGGYSKQSYLLVANTVRRVLETWGVSGADADNVDRTEQEASMPDDPKKRPSNTSRYSNSSAKSKTTAEKKRKVSKGVGTGAGLVTIVSKVIEILGNGGKGS